MWEILSYGEIPYNTMSNTEALEFVISGKRLSQPEHCPESLYEIMKECWAAEPDDRPSFDQLRTKILPFVGTNSQVKTAKLEDATSFYQ
jgi:fyn-related kinase